MTVKVSVIKSNYESWQILVGLVDVDIHLPPGFSDKYLHGEEDPVADFGRMSLPMMLLLEACRINNAATNNIFWYINTVQDA